MSKEVTPAVINKDMAVGYDDLKLHAGQMGPYTRVRLSLDVALKLAAMSPYPGAVKVGVMKAVANNEQGISVHQMGILLGWAADRAQR